MQLRKSIKDEKDKNVYVHILESNSLMSQWNLNDVGHFSHVVKISGNYFCLQSSRRQLKVVAFRM